ncbi:acyltransferase family protein [Limibaculum sp. M0105]|uniref:Acyltransferase family protein n=1 Tax=Thermohalobaculum xanthum TaxID=2753746 RepID=A0A8J7M540_9RHOB|nr:acyltransferase family protein [Thermohalobaculum xanthum]MBK0397897.1 acyltransferase family protein [Thermohalobaculum xanthum]
MVSPLRPNDADYRADIDGLRAVAVLSVVAFHVASSGLPGGFAGVDIFFVISGFLITRIILREIESGTFSYAGFYGRRIRRIFPALVLVIAATLGLGWWILLPDEYESLARHAIAGALFSSNILLWLEAGYFDIDAARKPFLHLWSLGVEEQFYIFWPVLLAATWRLARGRVAVVVTIGLASFAANLMLVLSDPDGAFYLPVTRFWELLAGGGLAIWELRRRRFLRDGQLLPQPLADAASLGGGVLCILSFVSLDKTLAYPGWAAVAPVLGSVLMIAAGPNGLVNRYVLARRPVVYIGLISYPLYLWHWPLLSFIAIVQIQDQELRLVAELAAVMLALLASMATYHFLELPLRRGVRYGQALKLSAGMAMVVLVATSLVASRGAAELRGPWNLAEAPQAPASDELHTRTCVSAHGDLFREGFNPGRDFCVASGSDLSRMVVLGDSHANRLYSGLSRVAPHGVAMIGKRACIPVLGGDGVRHGKPLGCATAMADIARRVAAARPDAVILHGYFFRPYWQPLDPQAIAGLTDGLRQMLAALSPSSGTIVIVLGMPELPFHPSRCIRRPIQAAVPECRMTRDAYDRQKALTEAGIREAASGFGNVRIFDPATVLCDDVNCAVIRDDELLYGDTNHLSVQGAEIVARALLRFIEAEDVASR